MYNDGMSKNLLSASDARAGLPDLLDRVEAGEEIMITRHAKPIAVVLSPAKLRTRRTAELDEDLARIQEAITGERSLAAPTMTENRAEDLLGHVRDSRQVR